MPQANVHTWQEGDEWAISATRLFGWDDVCGLCKWPKRGTEKGAQNRTHPQMATGQLAMWRETHPFQHLVSGSRGPT